MRTQPPHADFCAGFIPAGCVSIPTAPDRRRSSFSCSGGCVALALRFRVHFPADHKDPAPFPRLIGHLRSSPKASWLSGVMARGTGHEPRLFTESTATSYGGIGVSSSTGSASNLTERPRKRLLEPRRNTSLCLWWKQSPGTLNSQRHTLSREEKS